MAILLLSLDGRVASAGNRNRGKVDAEPWKKGAIGTVRGQLDALPPIDGLAIDVRFLHDGQFGS